MAKGLPGTKPLAVVTSPLATDPCKIVRGICSFVYSKISAIRYRLDGMSKNSIRGVNEAVDLGREKPVVTIVTKPNVGQSLGAASSHERTPSGDAGGDAMMALIEELFPICRSITGNGVRETLSILAKHIPLEVHEVPSGTPVFDWTVPQEWNIKDAYIARADGAHVVDFTANNLHIVQYSRPIDAVMSLAELRPHLHSLPDKPDWIPYRTSYYTENWGFCLTHRELSTLTDGLYRVVVDADLAPGHLSYGELLIPGESDDTVLLSCHICHPSLANDNLSGIAVATMLARHLRMLRRRYSYRFLFIPGTIGSLTWLARNEDKIGHILHGLVLSCLGDAGGMTYKQSRRGDAAIDRIVGHVLRHDEMPHRITPFVPYGYDERQYCSPGFDLPIGCLMRTPNGEYPEYHSSGDDLSLVRPESLAHSLAVLRRITAVIEGDAIYRSRNPKGEPQLGRRGLYTAMGGQRTAAYDTMALLWVLNLADGRHSLLDMAERAGLPFTTIRAAADALAAAELLGPLLAER
jgi:aminopeptidase-like protein